MGGGRDIAALRSQLAAKAERLVLDLLGEPTAKGRRSWRWGSRGSLSYDFQQHHWHSFETGQGGDLLDLIQFNNPGWDLRRAIGWAGEWLGLPTHRPIRQTPPRHLPLEQAGTHRALHLWQEARPARGTLVETYLRQRGLTLPDGSDEVLRFHPDCPRGDARLPAMLGLMRSIDGDRPAGIHRTFLRPDGRAKADVEPNKMMLGPAKGAVLKLTPDAEVTMGLGLSEGIEDGLAVLAKGFAPVWACLSAGAMAAFPVLGGIEQLTVFADNDAPGARAAQACVGRWQRSGKEARVVAPPRRFKDFGAIAGSNAEGRRHG